MGAARRDCRCAWEHGWSGGPESFTVIPFRDCSELAVHQVWCGERFPLGGLPGEAFVFACGWS